MSKQSMFADDERMELGPAPDSQGSHGHQPVTRGVPLCEDLVPIARQFSSRWDAGLNDQGDLETLRCRYAREFASHEQVSCELTVVKESSPALLASLLYDSKRCRKSRSARTT